MQAQEHSAACGAVETNMIKKDKRGAEKSFVKQKDGGGNRAVARPVAVPGATPAPDEEHGNQKKRHPARHPMCKFDQRLHLAGGGQDFAIAERPVTAASGAGPAGADVCTPKNDGDVVCDNKPCKTGGAAGASPRDSRKCGVRAASLLSKQVSGCV